MVSWWRGFALAGLLIAGFTGCSGESNHGGDDSSAAHGGSSGAGHGGSGGIGGSGTNKSGTGGGGAGGTTFAEGGAAGSDENGAIGGTSGHAGRAAAGGASAVGGAGGAAFAGRGGSGVTAGATASAGSGSGVPVGWWCSPDAYQDGTCDCGCGAKDADCKKTDIDHCERCNASGSCAGTNAVCPGRIDEKDTAQCIQSPVGWTCSNAIYADGETCDCGCGVPDPDCADGTLGSCDTCSAAGSCAHADCPASIDPNDNSTCYVPAGWLCSDFDYGDAFCDCGCGILDPVCADSTLASCDFCPDSSCAASTGCDGYVDPNDNTQCTVPPPQWRCAARLYRDGARCDCGCGYPDPDCDSLDVSACDNCDDDGSCSGTACPGIIDPDHNEQCQRPDHPPDGWLCPDSLYADGYACECGCGIPDPDCHGDTISSCLDCPRCSSIQDCADTVLASDTTQCRPPPDGWTCDISHYRDSICDCGCGIEDPDCSTKSPSECYECPDEGCTAGKCKHLSSTDNSTCAILVPSTWACDRTFYDDGVCDCGCGAPDLDCATADAGACDICNDTGSCASAKCPATIDPTDNSSCSN